MQAIMVKSIRLYASYHGKEYTFSSLQKYNHRNSKVCYIHYLIHYLLLKKMYGIMLNLFFGLVFAKCIKVHQQRLLPSTTFNEEKSRIGKILKCLLLIMMGYCFTVAFKRI
jgi:hypothetical protein